MDRTDFIHMGHVACYHCGSPDVQRRSRRGLFDMLQKLFRRWPYVCRRCTKDVYSKYREKLKPPPTSRVAPEPSPRAVVDCVARRQGASAAVVIRAENDYQLTNILRALSRAVEAEQLARA